MALSLLGSQRPAFDELAGILFLDIHLDDVLHRVTETARRNIVGAAEISVTLIDAGKAVTAACSGALALKLDERQYETGSGPQIADKTRAAPGAHSQPGRLAGLETT